MPTVNLDVLCQVHCQTRICSYLVGCMVPRRNILGILIDIG